MVRWIDGLKRSAPKQTPGTSSSLRQNSQQTPHPRASLANKFYLPQRRLQSENGGNLPYMGACINIAQWLWGPSAPRPISLKCHWTHRPRVKEPTSPHQGLCKHPRPARLAVVCLERIPQTLPRKHDSLETPTDPLQSGLQGATRGEGGFSM